MLPYRPLMARHGRYTILGKLADGGMAEIFLATQHGAEGFEKHVVLKRILTAFSADPQFSNMFIDEAHISMSLQHSNIVQVLDLGVAGSRYFLVMELVDGWDLERILKRAHGAGVVFPPALSLYVVTVVCRALAYAHAKARAGKPLGIVHRDISPNNVLISEQGEIKLADFGIAKAQRKREQTAAGVIKGKVAYMSPEQATGAAIDRRSDIFALGSLLYRMVTNALPFEAPSDLEQLLRVQKADLTPDEMLADVERVLRTEFHSAGQTELKLWLEQLGRRDGEVSIGKRRLDTSGIVKDELSTDLSAGTSFELDEVTTGHTEAAFTPPPLPVGSGAPVSRPETKVERSGRGLTPPPALTPSPAPTPSPVSMPAAPRKRFGGFWLGAIFALGGVIGGKLLLDWAEHEGVMGKLGLGGDGDRGPVQGPPAPVHERPAPPPAPVKAAPAPAPAPVPAPAPAPAPEKVAPVAVAPADGSAAPVAKAAPDATAPVAEATPGKDAAASADAKVNVAQGDDNADDTDEEELLKNAVPNPEQTVIGANGAEPAPEKPEAPHESGKHEGAPTGAKAARPAAKAKPAPAHATAVLHLRTTPVGAVVRTKGQVLGRTPINLHFRTGNTYELTFFKSGYQPQSRMVAVTNVKDKTLALSLKKRPAPKKRSIFHPHR
jgi:serine/threonine-protein kinase